MAVATSLAIAGAVTAAASSGASFIQAGKQQRLQRQAEMEAEKAMAEARKKLDVNFYDQLAINKEPYELQREALLSQGAQAIAAGAESERGAAATAGRVMMAQNEAQAGVRTAMGNEMQALEKMSAMEDSRLRDVNVQLDLEQVAGAQRAARDAQRQAAQATMQGINSASSAIGQGLALVPLYMKQGSNESNLFKPAMQGTQTTPGAPVGGALLQNMNKAPMDVIGSNLQFSSSNANKNATYDPYYDPMNPYGAYSGDVYSQTLIPQNVTPQWQTPFDPFGFKPY